MNIKIGKESRKFLGIYSILWIGFIIGLILEWYSFAWIMFGFAIFDLVFVVNWIKNGWLKD